MISISSRPNSPPSPACGLSPLTAMRRRRRRPDAPASGSVAAMTRHTRAGVMASIAWRTLWCSVAWAILVSPKHSIMKTWSGSVPVSRATKEGWPSKAMPATRDRSFVLRRSDHRIHFVRDRGLDGGSAERDRGAAGGGADGAERDRVGLPALEHIEAVTVPVGIAGDAARRAWPPRCRRPRHAARRTPDR